ncbi:hypothetical protein KI387_018445, partial [Taxus chinensis]
DVGDNMDAMHEVFKHLDAQSLAVASCANRRWHHAAMDDSIWEVICIQRSWPVSLGRLRSV